MKIFQIFLFSLVVFLLVEIFVCMDTDGESDESMNPDTNTGSDENSNDGESNNAIDNDNEGEDHDDDDEDEDEYEDENEDEDDDSDFFTYDQTTGNTEYILSTTESYKENTHENDNSKNENKYETETDNEDKNTKTQIDVDYEATEIIDDEIVQNNGEKICQSVDFNKTISRKLCTENWKYAFYYDSNEINPWQRCKEFWNGGCGKMNQLAFNTEDECYRTCAKDVDMDCTFDHGPKYCFGEYAKDKWTLFYTYDPVAKECIHSWYGNCSTFNYYTSMKDCKAKCVKKD